MFKTKSFHYTIVLKKKKEVKREKINACKAKTLRYLSNPKGSETLKTRIK